MKTLIACMAMTLLLPVAALATDYEDTPHSQNLTNEEARDIAKSPEYAELSDTHARANVSRTDVASTDMNADDELPRTASPLPLLALLGGGSLAGALGIRKARNGEALR